MRQFVPPVVYLKHYISTSPCATSVPNVHQTTMYRLPQFLSFVCVLSLLFTICVSHWSPMPPTCLESSPCSYSTPLLTTHVPPRSPMSPTYLESSPRAYSTTLQQLSGYIGHQCPLTSVYSSQPSLHTSSTPPQTTPRPHWSQCPLTSLYSSNRRISHRTPHNQTLLETFHQTPSNKHPRNKHYILQTNSTPQ